MAPWVLTYHANLSEIGFSTQKPITERNADFDTQKRGVVFNHIFAQGWNENTKTLMQRTHQSLDASIAEKRKDLLYNNMYELNCTQLDEIVANFFKFKPSPPKIVIPGRNKPENQQLESPRRGSSPERMRRYWVTDQRVRQGN